MDLAASVALIDAWFRARQRPWVLIGGLAMVSLGSARATFDVDVAADVGDQESFIEALERLGFETLHRSSGYSNHVRAGERIDVVWLAGATSEAVLQAAQPRSLGPGLVVPVAAPDHLAALKIHAMSQDPQRQLVDLADLRHLLTLPGVDVGEIERRLRGAGLGRWWDVLTTKP